MEKIAVWQITREYRGLAEAGGLKDMVRDMSTAMAATGCRVTVVLPFYGFMEKSAVSFTRSGFSFGIRLYAEEETETEERVEVLRCEMDGVNIFCLKSRLFDSLNDVYSCACTDSTLDSRPRYDTPHCAALHVNVLFQRAVLELLARVDEKPSVIHCHDAHAALVPVLMHEHPDCRRRFGETALIVTIHNAGPGYQQDTPDTELFRHLTGLSSETIGEGMVSDSIFPFLLASRYARMTTVSPDYALELLSRDDHEFSCGLGKAFRERGIELTGIYNGVDPSYLDPVNPLGSGLPAGYDPDSDAPAGKRICRSVFLRAITERSFPAPLEVHGTLDAAPDAPLYTFHARLTYQKGIAVLYDSLVEFLRTTESVRIAILGQGENRMENDLISLASSAHGAGRVCFIRGYHEPTAKLLFTAGDFFIMSSIYEPCGITDLLAQLAGNIPIVHGVGGLMKILDGETGYSYRGAGSQALLEVLKRSHTDFRSNPAGVSSMRRHGRRKVLATFTWDRIVRERYLPLYEESRCAMLRT